MERNTKRFRLFGGNNVLVYYNNNVRCLGHLITGTLTDKTASQEITFLDGGTLKLDGKRTVTLNLTLAQTTKEELELIDELRNKNFPMFYDNGLVDYQNQIYFFPKAIIKPTLTLKDSDNPMNIIIELEIEPLSSKVELENDSNMIPYELLLKLNTRTVSDNNFYLLSKKQFNPQPK